MKIHEFQAKELLREYGVPLPQSCVASTADEAAEKAKTLGEFPVVVKAQVHVGQHVRGGADVIVALGKPIHTTEPAKDMGEEFEPIVGRETPA